MNKYKEKHLHSKCFFDILLNAVKYTHKESVFPRALQAVKWEIREDVCGGKIKKTKED